jgi:hypothetical protein
MLLPSTIGVLVEGMSIDLQTPLSGHFPPVFAVIPIGFLLISVPWYVVE